MYLLIRYRAEGEVLEFRVPFGSRRSPSLDWQRPLSGQAPEADICPAVSGRQKAQFLPPAPVGSAARRRSSMSKLWRKRAAPEGSARSICGRMIGATICSATRDAGIATPREDSTDAVAPVSARMAEAPSATITSRPVESISRCSHTLQAEIHVSRGACAAALLAARLPF